MIFLQIREFVKDRVHLNSSTEMKGFWGDFIVLLVGDEFGDEIVAECCQVVNCLWELMRDAVDCEVVDVEDIRQTFMKGFIELIKVVTKSHGIAKGYVLGRAMIGSLVLMADRTDVSAYQRVLDGVLENSKET